jgi:glucan 1,3-beta-glucosidase
MLARSFAVALALSCYSGVHGSAGTLGFALGNKRADGSCKNTADYQEDMRAIRDNSGSEIVRQ